MKQFFTALLALILVFAGIWIYDDVSGRKLHEFLGVNNVAMNIGDSSTNDNSGYRLNVTSNLGTVIDYVDYETISDEEYEIETEGFNRQFCELSIYNTETEEQLQNNSELTIGDELQINLAIPEGYRLNAFFINGYYADFSELITVTGNAEIYIDISRISCQMVTRMFSHNDSIGSSVVTVESDGVVTDYEFFDNLVYLCDLYFGDIVTIKMFPNENDEVEEFSLSERFLIDDYFENNLFFYNVGNSGPELIDNTFSFIVLDVDFYDMVIFFGGIND